MTPGERDEVAAAAWVMASMAAAINGEDVTTVAALLHPAANWLKGPGGVAEGPMMSLTAGREAKEEEEGLEAAEGSIVSMEGSRRREASKVVDVEQASFTIEFSWVALESTTLPLLKSLLLRVTSETPPAGVEEEEAA